MPPVHLRSNQPPQTVTPRAPQDSNADLTTALFCRQGQAVGEGDTIPAELHEVANVAVISTAVARIGSRQLSAVDRVLMGDEVHVCAGQRASQINGSPRILQDVLAIVAAKALKSGLLRKLVQLRKAEELGGSLVFVRGAHNLAA